MHPIAFLLPALSSTASAAQIPDSWLAPPAQTSPLQDDGTTPTSTDTTDTTSTATAAGATEAHHRESLMELNFRTRYMSVPNSILDIWYYRTSNSYDRPKIRGLDLGLEYGLSKGHLNWTFYGEYIHAIIQEGYWDDVEEPAQHDDGDWVRPNGFGIVGLGANIGSETDLTSTDKDVWLSLGISGGLGLGITTGSLMQWHPGSNPDNTDPSCLPTSPAYSRYDSCPNDGTKNVPKVVPIVDITTDAKVHFANRATLRIEGGLHDVLYYGAAVGGVF